MTGRPRHAAVVRTLDLAPPAASDMDAPGERLRRIAALAEVALGEDGRWLAAAIHVRLAGGSKSLDAALGFSRRGGATPDVQARNARRDAIIREFAVRFLGEEMKPRDQARALLNEIDRFQVRGEWSRLAGRRSCPHHLVGTRTELLFRLLKIGRVPGLRQVSEILAAREIRTAALSCTTRPA